LKSKGYIEVPDVETNKSKLVKLFNQDQIYEQIRTMYVSEIFVHLKKAVRLLKDIREVKCIWFIFINKFVKYLIIYDVLEAKRIEQFK
jgi:hypothetical protein